MNLKSIKTKLSSYQNILKIVESQKNVTLINILKMSKKNIFYLSRCLETKSLIEAIVKQYDVSHYLLNSNKSLNLKSFFKSKQENNNKILWVYVTEDEKYATNSYLKQEQNILRLADKDRDTFVLIGKRANNFGDKNGFSPVFSYHENDVPYLAQVLPSLIENHILDNGYHDVRFVLNAAKIKSNHIDVLPIHKLNLRFDVENRFTEKNFNLKKLRIYPDVNKFIDAEFNSYISYATLALLSESWIINEKYKLVAQNQTINDLEEKIRRHRLMIIREKRELEVEETSILSKKKDLLHTRGLTKNGN
ncbi:MSC_0622 family F1-like ATPase gamma subunit [Mycoplasma sp. Ms02]|uniref:MSC_0622 family F1-like ATPase gamma subunit n=1 Tax=Mycoplasma sp. Ms02 TaxID=353851 RepID=UPI001C895E28|nr:hypothetical protein [Mycoplasma sp. Ms02]QZE12324.1 hypothetical protein K4L35_03255 [Mycoplasma sp. Ms02]